MKKILLSERTALTLLVSGFTLMIVFLFVFMLASNEGFSLHSRPDTNLISKYGDIIGGVTGSLWALAGVVLFYLALESQKESYELNRKSFDKQIEALENQIEEFKAHGAILKRTAVAQENTQQLINEQIQLEKIHAKLDLYSSLASVHSELARLEDSINIRTRYKEKSSEYITRLNQLVEEIDKDLRHE